MVRRVCGKSVSHVMAGTTQLYNGFGDTISILGSEEGFS
jgi:hypothetical protein